MTETMQRWSMDALGRENLKLTQAPVPQPGPGEVRVRVNAVALNYRDKMVVEGTMPIPLSFPFTPASDMAGVVDSVSVRRCGWARSLSVVQAMRSKASLVT